MKKIWTWITSFILAAVLVISGVATFLILTKNWNNKNNEITQGGTLKESPRKDVSKFISERSFSLKLHMDNGYLTYGTGWLMASDTDKTSYYIATNLHVAATIQNSGKQYYKYDRYSDNKPYEWISDINGRFTKLEFGQVLNNGNFWTDKINNNIDDTIYHSTISSQYVSVAYTPIEYFKNEQKGIKLSNGRFYNKEIRNPTIDFAVIKIDSKQVKPTNKQLKYSEEFNKALNIFKNNPTKFAKASIKTDNEFKEINDTFHIGGFPYKEFLDKRNGKWDSLLNLKQTSSQYFSYGTKADFLFNGNQNYDMLFEKYKNSKPNQWSQNDFDKNYLIPGTNIHFQTDEFAGYKNIGAQIMFNEQYVNQWTDEPILSGGSSGSMVINDKLEVIGIYWGAYSFSSGEYGAVDLLINDFTKNNEYEANKYDVIKDFKTRIPTAIIQTNY